VPSDITARYHRLRGDQVLMVSGTDEHGTPVMVAADREGLSPRETADRYSRVTREALRDLGLSYDLFTRTTTRNHYRVVQDLFKTLYEHGHIVEQTAMGAFSATTGNTLPDRYIEGTCPICGFESARGDQCDNCGNQLDPIDLINPHSRINGETPIFTESEHYFLDLPALAGALGAWLQTRTDWRPNVLRFSLNLPTEVVSSEFLTMSGSKFSTSRKTVIYVGDFLREYGPDALRYFIAAAGPENQDADFTWDEFVRRTNFELANEWGNLVNRSISMAHKNFGRIPQPGPRTDLDAELLRASEQAFTTVGDLLARSRFKAASGEAMRVAGLANKYLSDSEPWKLGGDPERQATVLHTALQVVDDAKTLLTPFLPHSSQRVFEALGGEGIWAAQPEIREVTDFNDDVEGVGAPGVVDYPVLTGDYAAEQASWQRTDIEVGRPLIKPTPLFTKLDPKLGETGPSWAPIA
jgi:methionyl-tRNA synthetase